jgi:opacity protein-like surface antigen
MKKILLISLLIILIQAAGNSQFTKVGGGITGSTGFHFNNESDSDYRSGLFGISLKGIYEITLPLHISPSFTYVIPHVTTTDYETGSETSRRVSSMMIDVNGHYVFNSLEQFEFYGLAGLNINFARSRYKSTVAGTTSKIVETDNVLGLNLGAGTYWKLADQLDLYAEAKYILSRYDHFIFNAGVLINLDWLTKHEEKPAK